MKKLGLIFLLATLGCQSKPGPGSTTIWIPEDLEIVLGSLTSQSFAALFPPYEDSRWQGYIQELGKKITRVSERPDFGYRFVVAASTIPNAFSAPDGTIFITTGLLKICADNEQEIAAVLSHEVAHVARRHGALLLQQRTGWRLLLLALFGVDTPALAVAGHLAGTLKSLGYGREMELDADQAAIRYLKKLGYPPAALHHFLVKMAGQEKRLGIPGENYLVSHPPIGERLKALQ
ncbi:MAG: M48 family metalloprotease [Elusimicrobia bacterium]|nr:M48 family metalloprotease [Elusimicrobiota bacterium]